MVNDESKDALIDKLQAEIKKKDETLRKVEESINKLNEKFQTQDNLINSLKDSLKLKDDQIKTIHDSLQLKDQQIKAKDEKIVTLEKEIEMKEEKLKTQASSVINENLLKEKDEKINTLQKEIEILNDELSKADVDLETLELENEKLRQAQSSLSDGKIIDFTKTEITKSEILKKMREILENGLHNVMIVVPNIVDLQELYLYEVKSSVNMRISCLINPEIDEHSELLDEFTSLDNITLRSYEREDRYVLVRDGEEMFIAVKGNSENNHLAIHTKDPKHIRLFNSLTMEGWLQSRGI